MYVWMYIDAIDIHLLYVHDEARAKLGHGLPEEAPFFQFDHLSCQEPNMKYMLSIDIKIKKEKGGKKKKKKRK